MNARYLLIVKVARGLNVLDRPSPLGKGAYKRRAEPVGAALEAMLIVNIGGVPYARLVPRDPNKPEWVRVREADSSIEYVEVIDLDNSVDSDNTFSTVANAIRSGCHEIAQALLAAITMRPFNK